MKNNEDTAEDFFPTFVYWSGIEQQCRGKEVTFGDIYIANLSMVREQVVTATDVLERKMVTNRGYDLTTEQ
jgi:hypothetical protein